MYSFNDKVDFNKIDNSKVIKQEKIFLDLIGVKEVKNNSTNLPSVSSKKNSFKDSYKVQHSFKKTNTTAKEIGQSLSDFEKSY